MILVRDMEIGKRYLVNGVARELKKKVLIPGAGGGSGNQEPLIDLYFKGLRFFEGQLKIRNDWDDKYEEVSSGGKRKSTRKSTRNQISKKSRKTHRKTNRCR